MNFLLIFLSLIQIKLLIFILNSLKIFFLFNYCFNLILIIKFLEQLFLLINFLFILILPIIQFFSFLYFELPTNFPTIMMTI